MGFSKKVKMALRHINELEKDDKDRHIEKLKAEITHLKRLIPGTPVRESEWTKMRERVEELETALSQTLRQEIEQATKIIKLESQLTQADMRIEELEKVVDRAIKWIQHDCPWEEDEIRKQLIPDKGEG